MKQKIKKRDFFSKNPADLNYFQEHAYKSRDFWYNIFDQEKDILWK